MPRPSNYPEGERLKGTPGRTSRADAVAEACLPGAWRRIIHLSPPERRVVAALVKQLKEETS